MYELYHHALNLVWFDLIVKVYKVTNKKRSSQI